MTCASAPSAADLCPPLQHRLFPRQGVPAQVKALIERGALFVINDSGGKDSQAMKNFVRANVPHRQLLIVHAPLREVDWEGGIEHINRYSFGIPVLLAEAKRSFWEMVEARGMFPSPKQRQCTSDLKRTPIEREIRRYLGLYAGIPEISVSPAPVPPRAHPGR